MSFTVEANGTNPLNYQWQKNGVNVNGATAATLTLYNVQLADNNSTYRAVVSNSAGSTTSNSAILKVLDNNGTRPPNITSQPVADQNATIGSNVTFNVDANGTGLNYQWQKRDANGTWVNIGGATGSSYTINSVQSIHAGIYRVAIINASGGTTYSSNSVLNVAAPQNNAPVITQHPQNANAIAGQNVAFTVAATGNGPSQLSMAEEWCAYSPRQSGNPAPIKCSA